MNANEFDRVIRDRLSGVTETAPDVWEGISRGLARRHRRVILRRFATGAVAAAAGLAVAFLVFRGPQDTRQVTAPIRTAQAVQPVLPQETPDAPVELDIYPGADAELNWYEDDGITYRYEEGLYRKVRIRWDDTQRLLSLDAQEGRLKGDRRLTVRVRGNNESREILYTGGTEHESLRDLFSE